ncbi:MAG: hypothetical protein U5K72_13490 [Balneolaceae bacterium]|nr:hypothetical protein [Balneolaceae bacterium]
MTRKTLIRETVQSIKKLPDHKLKEVSDFVDFLLNQLEHAELNDQIAQAAFKSKTFEFLQEEEELYSDDDLKESYE